VVANIYQPSVQSGSEISRVHPCLPVLFLTPISVYYTEDSFTVVQDSISGSDLHYFYEKGDDQFTALSRTSAVQALVPVT
jgi:hypothetical protein